MIVVFDTDASTAAIEIVERRLAEELPQLHLRRIDGAHRAVIAAIGDAEAVAELGLEVMAGVDRVVPIDRSYKLASIEATHHQPTTFALGDRRIGPEHLLLILGPCTVESHAGAIAAAEACAAAGASAIRAGIFKPRTSPFAFQGPGVEGLATLAEIRRRTGLPLVSELTSPEHGEALAAVADVIQIGARNMQNYQLLREAGRLGRPVLLKRGLAATLDELLQAADYILREGEERVILCERGIRSFDSGMRFTLDLGAVPALRSRTHLPVIVDPSHAAGDRRFVAPLARAAVAVGADGLIVEATIRPDEARCDAAQQLEARELEGFVAELFALARTLGRDPA